MDAQIPQEVRFWETARNAVERIIESGGCGASRYNLYLFGLASPLFLAKGKRTRYNLYLSVMMSEENEAGKWIRKRNLVRMRS